MGFLKFFKISIPDPRLIVSHSITPILSDSSSNHFEPIARNKEAKQLEDKRLKRDVEERSPTICTRVSSLPLSTQERIKNKVYRELNQREIMSLSMQTKSNRKPATPSNFCSLMWERIKQLPKASRQKIEMVLLALIQTEELKLDTHRGNYNRDNDDNDNGVDDEIDDQNKYRDSGIEDEDDDVDSEDTDDDDDDDTDDRSIDDDDDSDNEEESDVSLQQDDDNEDDGVDQFRQTKKMNQNLYKNMNDGKRAHTKWSRFRPRNHNNKNNRKKFNHKKWKGNMSH